MGDAAHLAGLVTTTANAIAALKTEVESGTACDGGDVASPAALGSVNAMSNAIASFPVPACQVPVQSSVSVKPRDSQLSPLLIDTATQAAGMLQRTYVYVAKAEGSPPGSVPDDCPGLAAYPLIDRVHRYVYSDFTGSLEVFEHAVDDYTAPPVLTYDIQRGPSSYGYACVAVSENLAGSTGTWTDIATIKGHRTNAEMLQQAPQTGLVELLGVGSYFDLSSLMADGWVVIDEHAATELHPDYGPSGRPEAVFTRAQRVFNNEVVPAISLPCLKRASKKADGSDGDLVPHEGFFILSLGKAD